MLGLSLAIRVGKRVLGGLIESLMSAVKGRATYSENNTDSKAVVKDIDNYDLLDKASILLTPTATSDAIVHSVKTYTGDELVTNGTFDTDSDWSKGNKWSISGGTANKATDATSNISQAIDGISGKLHKVVFTVSNYGGNGGVGASADGSNYTQNEGNGTFTEYITPNSNNLYIRASYSFVGSIDNISVIDVSSDFNFDRASSATRINSSGLVQDMQSITDPELVLNGDFEELGDELVTDGDFPNLDNWSVNNGDYATIVDGALNSNNTENGSWFAENISQNISFVNGKTYKVTFKAKNISGNLNLRITHQSHVVFSNNLTSSFVDYTVYYTAQANNDSIRIFCNDAIGEFQIDNVSVQQVDPNDRWSLGTGWSIEDGKLVANSSSNGNDARQLNLLEQSRDYKLSIDISKTSGTDVKLKIYNGSSFVTIAELDESSTVNFSTSATNNGTLYVVSNAFVGTIDNISVKDITFSTDVDLARINYDSNGDNGHILLEPTSTNLVPYSEDFSEWTLGSNSTLTYESDVVAPDGSLGVYRLTNPASSSTFIQSPSFSSSNPLTVSLYVKSTGSGNDNFNFYTGATNVSDLKTATSEWQRFDYTADGSSMYIINSGDTYASDIYIWGAQAEALSYATSYIPTHGSTVTRATETLTGSGNSTLINSTEGVLYAEIAALNDDISQQIGVYGDSTSKQLRIEIANSVIRGQLFNGAFQANMSSTQTVKNFNKVAFKWKADDFALWINGTEVATDSSGTTFSANDLDRVHFTGQNGSTSAAQAKVKALAVFNEALEDDEIELLTGVTNYGSFGELASANGYTII